MPKTDPEANSPFWRKVVTREPYAPARRVFWIVDNGSARGGTSDGKR